MSAEETLMSSPVGGDKRTSCVSNSKCKV